MGAITRGIAGNLTTSGVFTSSAINNNSVTNVTSFASVTGGGAIKLIKTVTASSSAEIEFVHGSGGVTFDGTYNSYIFKFHNMHPATDNQRLAFQCSTDSGSTYALTITSTHARAMHTLDGATDTFGYNGGDDQAQGTGFQNFIFNNGTDNDQAGCGELQFYDPADTASVKQFIARGSSNAYDDRARDDFVGGYVNTSSAVNAIKFKFVSGNIDSGSISMYGVSTS